MTAVFEGTGLSAEQLDDIYNTAGDGEHPELTRAMWRVAVAQEETVSGYWQWLAHQITMKPDEIEVKVDQKTTPMPQSHFVVIQEGGASTELYVHSLDTAADADDYRADCTRDGAYRTSPWIEVPDALAGHPQF
ncbi:MULTISPECIES: hypothetical protein [unclassified Cupriavidus]|uniref:hypothetical protein n=1 Tax=unclassified Cupriavidus TaxID=2640874 RepID=UPI00313E3CF7